MRKCCAVQDEVIGLTRKFIFEGYEYIKRGDGLSLCFFIRGEDGKTN